MYEAHWGLGDKPFRNTPDARYLFFSPACEEAFTRALYAIAEGLGGLLLTGEVGCGKTLALRTLLAGLDPARYEAAYVAFPGGPPDGFLRQILRGFGYRPDGWTLDDLRRGMAHFLGLAARRGAGVVVAVDEAQTIGEAGTWDELRLLLNHQRDRQFGLTLLVAGQPELRDRLSRQPPLAQRLAVQAHLGRLSPAETGAYLRHRLAKAGGAPDLFDPEAVGLLAEASGGVPRRLNHLADLALLAGFGGRARRIDGNLARQALAEVPVWETVPEPIA